MIVARVEIEGNHSEPQKHVPITMDPRIWKARLVDKLGVLIIHAHHDEDGIVKVVVWDAFWAM